jgi:hypothetical protein
MEKLLKKVYYDTRSPACYAGVRKVYLEAKRQNPLVTIRLVKDFLEKERTYTLFRSVRHRYKRLKTIPAGLNVDWQADLIDMSQLSEHNQGYRYILNVVDALSRMLYTAPVKSKHSVNMIEAFEKVFEKAQAKPWRLMTDRGVEFVAKDLMDYYNKKDIIKKVAYTNDEVKCAMVERANRTLLERLYKYFSENNTLEWIKVLDKIVHAINRTVHTTTGIRPIDVTYKNANAIREDLIYKRESTNTRNAQFKVGDHVRISYRKKPFRKGYLPNFTDEIFTIEKARNTKPPTYLLVDDNGEQIKGWFYNENLVRTSKDTTYRIEKVLRERKLHGKKEYFVKFIGYDDKHNLWITEDQLVA